jgi:hypothetical protein
VKLLFDNCTSPTLATTLDGFIQHFGHRAIHIKDIAELPRGRHSADIEWISFLKDHPDDWAFVTADDRLRRNKPERLALRSSGLHGFVLAKAFAKTPLNQCAALLLWRWPDMEQITSLVAAPALHELPINKNSKISALPL